MWLIGLLITWGEITKGSQRKVKDMRWSTVPFGKYKGKTFPEIIVRDPDWFFWVLPNLYGTLAEEAQELARRARAIKTPRRSRRRLEVEYEFDRDRRFYGFEFVDADSPPSRWSLRLPYLDLRRPLRLKDSSHRSFVSRLCLPK